MAEATTFYALLVGIDEYKSPAVPPLRGCVRDVETMGRLLQDRFAVPAENVLTLTNSEATYQDIKEAFRSHLIERGRAAVEAGGEASTFLFHYSGHGSQARNVTGDESDGLDETLVPYDSRTQGVYDIKDWELRALVRELGAFSDNVTVILDCCHSGTGLRAGPGIVSVRRAPVDDRLQPEAPARGTLTGGIREVLDGERHVLVAGCRDREESYEHPVRVGNDLQSFGALTYFLTRRLTAVTPERVPTYEEIMEQVRVEVNHSYPNQSPQVEGKTDRLLFSGLSPVQDLFFTLQESRDGLIWFDGGAAVGITPGTLLNVYPPATRTREGAADPLGQLRIERVELGRSGGKPIEDGTTFPPLSRAAIAQLAVDVRPLVVLDVDPETARRAHARLDQKDVTAYLEVSDYVVPAPYRVAAEADGRLTLQNPAGQPLTAPYDLGNPRQLQALGDDLIHLVRFDNAFHLQNPAPVPQLAGKVHLDIKEVRQDEAGNRVRRALPRTSGGAVVVTPGQRIAFEITNASSLTLLVGLLEFAPNWEVAVYFPPRNAHDTVPPDQTFRIEDFNGIPIEVYPLGEDELERRSLLKLIATKDEVDFHHLAQGPLEKPSAERYTEPTRAVPRSPLDRLFMGAMMGTRASFGALPAVNPDLWTTMTLPFLVVRKDDERAQRVTGGEATGLRGFEGLQIKPPPGFQGAVRVVTERQSTRGGAGDVAYHLPNGLEGHEQWFRPLVVPATRSVDPQGALIELEADEASLGHITPETPLEVYLPPGTRSAEDEVGVPFVLAHDGDFFYAVGTVADDPSVVEVGWLPDPAPTTATGEPAARDLKRVLHLYLFKLVGWEEPTLGLHRAHFIPTTRIDGEPLEPDERVWRATGGEVRYRALREGEVQSRQRVAVIVHGFQADTRGLVIEIGALLEACGVSYDHMLTFNYDTFSTSIEGNGAMLADALRAAEFGAHDGVTVDVFSHSMGTLVSRCMIELSGGAEFVDRCFLASLPTQGTSLASAAGFGAGLLSMVLNVAGAAPPALVAKWVLRKLREDAVGLHDLKPSSELLRKLEERAPHGTVPYYYLAGSNQLPPAEQGRWKRFYRKAMAAADVLLDDFFEDQNDMVIALKSMQGLQGKYPKHRLKDGAVPCNHFGYFVHPESKAKFCEWLRQDG